MSEAKREMTLPAIRKRFNCGSWDLADCLWLYAKAEQHAELLEALEQITAAHTAILGLLRATVGTPNPTIEPQPKGLGETAARDLALNAADPRHEAAFNKAMAAIRKAKGE